MVRHSSALSQTQVYRHQEHITREGEISDEMFFISRGSAEELKSGEAMRVYETGEHFGEDCLLSSSRRRMGPMNDFVSIHWTTCSFQPVAIGASTSGVASVARNARSRSAGRMVEAENDDMRNQAAGLAGAARASEE